VIVNIMWLFVAGERVRAVSVWLRQWSGVGSCGIPGC